MKKLKLFLLGLVTILTITSCTQNQIVRRYGGKQEITLKANEKLLNITWKESSMWVLTEDTTTHVKHFRESSAWGVWQGEVTIK